MTHKPEADLSAELAASARQVEAGGLYSHYKSPDQLYKVTGFVIMESTDEAAVVYQAQYGDKITFVRPLASWAEQVEYMGQIVPRFAKAESVAVE